MRNWPLKSAVHRSLGAAVATSHGVYEVVRVDQTVRRVLLADAAESALAAATADQPTLKHAALALALTGGTTFDEVLRVSPRD